MEALMKLKEEGETHVALCLARGKELPVLNGEDVYSVGVLASIGNIDTSKSTGPEIELTATCRVQLTGVIRTGPSETPFIRVTVRQLKNEIRLNSEKATHIMMTSLTTKIAALSHLHHPMFQPQIQLLTYKINQREAGELADLCAAVCTSAPERLQAVLEELNVLDRLKKVDLLLAVELQLGYLFQKTISNEIKKLSAGGTPSGSKSAGDEFRERLKGLDVPEYAMKVIDEEINRLGSLDSGHHEHYTCRNYLNWLTSLPWGKYTEDQLDLNQTRKVLDNDHHGMEEVKMRILEFIAMSQLKKGLLGKILCLVGPPGVGKTSVGKSIARSLGRSFYRFSVGGMNDVAEIKGHRRTYIGALPGKLIQALKQSKSLNPVILIDEIDKMSKNWDGDPASALLEALDPEQNVDFVDHYMDIPVDLSRVLFICTANSLETVPRPLLDRMEIIRLHGYFLEEKLHIAQDHLLPRLREDTGLRPDQVDIPDEALRRLIAGYSRDPGVRSLQKYLDRIFRKVAYKVVNGSPPGPITADHIEEYAGKPPFRQDEPFREPPPGVVNGLAYSGAGGSVLWIETVRIGNQGNKDRLKLTGQLGSVMQESARIAYSYGEGLLQAMHGVSLSDHYLHMHFAEGAVNKDGPSAGVAMVTSLISLALDIPVSNEVGMTGEVTLTGVVLPVGGIKEKAMAANRSGLKRIIVPAANRADVEALPEQLKSNIQFHFVSHYREVYPLLFSNQSKL
eukprot:TRINITY_DN4434_c0_g1_i1.p1 TRINITY_DN4434_c0_g1~~TRINITY_DN4434_c0_g1_i1.p1  ORF type:complete len:836 (+),score=206.27 TRINITY_DN4434_c0_g1_i1:306-2510(+)